MVKPNGTDLMCGMLRFTTLIDNLINFQEVNRAVSGFFSGELLAIRDV